VFTFVRNGFIFGKNGILTIFILWAIFSSLHTIVDGVIFSRLGRKEVPNIAGNPLRPWQ